MNHQPFKKHFCVKIFFVALILLFCFSSLTAHAQTTRTFVGRVGLYYPIYDFPFRLFPYRNPNIQLNLPAPGVTVTIKDNTTNQTLGTAVTDDGGYYTFTAYVNCFNQHSFILQPQQLANGTFVDSQYINSVPQCSVPNPDPVYITPELRWALPPLIPLKGARSDENYGNPSCQISGRLPSNGVSRGVGLPVNITNGNMYLSQTDYKLPGIGEAINLARSYNSSSLQSGIFGQGWSTDYDEKITVDNQNSNKIRIGLSDGRGVYFERANASSLFVSKTEGFFSQLVLNTNSTYTLTFKDGGQHQFSSGGRLISMKNRQGLQTTLGYDANSNLTSITDSFGRVLTVQMNNGLVTQVSDSIGLVAGYLYNPDGTLQTVNYPDGSKYQFEYVTVLGRPIISKVKDAAGKILEGHQYDSQGRATTSEKEGGVEKLTLQYMRIKGRKLKKQTHKRVVEFSLWNCNSFNFICGFA
jgi:YD repeat-containing protein